MFKNCLSLLFTSRCTTYCSVLVPRYTSSRCRFCRQLYLMVLPASEGITNVAELILIEIQNPSLSGECKNRPLLIVKTPK